LADARTSVHEQLEHAGDGNKIRRRRNSSISIGTSCSGARIRRGRDCAWIRECFFDEDELG
jgi:hypothetical protein